MSEENTNKVEQAAETAGEAAGAAQEAVDVVEGEVSDSVAEATASVAEAAEATGEALEAAAEAAEAVVPAIETTSVADAAVEAVAAQEAAHEALDAAVATAEAAEAAAEAVAETDAPAEVVEAAEAAAEAAQEVAEAANEAVVEVSNLTVGYTGELTGRVYTYADLEQEPDDEEEQLDEELMSLYESSLTEIAESEIVEGRVVRISDKDVVIDIGFKSDGIVARNEFPAEIEAGDEVEVYVERVEDRHGQLILSKRRADDLRRWQRIEDAFENEGVLEGDIVNRIKGGMVVDLFGTEAFLPGSQIDIRPVRDFDAYLGKRMEFKVVKINPINGNVVVSHKALIEKDLEEQRAQILSQMEAGQVLEGIVKNITDFGVFIDLGGVDGLLHITDLSWGRVGHPSELVELDQKMKVVVLDYDKERKRISLGLKQLQPHPWENIDEKFVENMEVEGRVVSITDYGAFVELEKGIEGLVHISEMSWTKHVKHPTEMVKMGETVKVKILNIDQEGRKISLGMKQLRPDPWSNLSDRFPVGTTTRGIVRNITNFGVFVELEPGVDGLVHISDLSWTKKIRHPGEVVKKGQEMDVVVLNVDEGNRRLSLGHKQIETDPWNQFSVAYAEGTDVDVKIIRFAENGVVVELPLEVEAFVPASHLSNNQGDIQSAYNVGDTIETRVIEFNSGDRKIIVSERAKHDQEVRAARNAERQEKQARRTRER
ncbi:MAG: 30S ribosomal protein S1, partial [Bacteroidota bacterium]